MAGSGIDQTLIAAAAAVAVVMFIKGTYRVFLSTSASRGARITTGVLGGLLIGASIYLTFTDLIGAAIGAVAIVGYLGYRHATRPRPDFVVQEDVLLDEAVSPELTAGLEDFASQVTADLEGSSDVVEVPDMPAMPQDSIRPSL